MSRGVRLSGPKDYRRVFSDPRRSEDAYFLLLGASNGAQSARLGLAIAKKCAVRAVDRNRIKRIVRESFRQNQNQLIGVDYVVLCRRKAIVATNRALFASLIRHWARVREEICAG